MDVCTLVTAYYPIKSKFSHDTYMKWIRNFFKLDAPIVMFTSHNMAPIIKGMRGDKPLVIYELEFEQLDTWIRYKDQWIAHHNLDHEKQIHTPELYAIWAQKPFFVAKTIEYNPFHTNYFFWCDVGAFRTESMNPIIQSSFPSTKHLPRYKILLSSVANLEQNDLKMANETIPGDFKHCDRIVGGLWGGGKEGCLQWLNEYTCMLERYFHAKRFAGKDQSVMLSAYLHNPNIAEIVKCNIPSIDIWFYLQHLCSDLTIPKEFNDSYNIKNVCVTMLGGLGNQLFQIACAFAHAKQHNGILKILNHKPQDDGRPMYWQNVLHRCESYVTDSFPRMLQIIHEKEATFHTPIPNHISHIHIQGYRQSPKYFHSYKQEIKKLFEPQESVLHTLHNKFHEILNRKEDVIVVHAIRTDYLKNDHNIKYYGPLNVSYYQTAIRYMCQHVKNPFFLLASDDPLYWIEVLKNIPELQQHPFMILSDLDEIHTFALLQQFYWYIIANSSFSWWAAWIADAKRVIAPSSWFGPAGPKQFQDIYDPSWIRI